LLFFYTLHYVKDQVIYHLVMYHLFIYGSSTIGLMLFASVLSPEAGLYLSILCYCYIFYAASMHRAENRLLRGGNKKTRWGNGLSACVCISVVRLRKRRMRIAGERW